MPGQVWATNNLGGYMYSDNLSEVLRTQVMKSAKFRQFADIKEAFGLSKGARFYWNVYSEVAAPGDALTEGVAIPQTNLTIRQESLEVTEYGNSVPFSEKLDDFSKHSVTEVINNRLRTDCRNTLDKQAYGEFDATLLTVTPAGGNSATAVELEETGSPTATNDSPLRKEHVARIVTIMAERNIPAYADDDYVAIGRPASFDDLQDDLEAIRVYTDEGMRHVFNGEIGRYRGCRFVTQTNIPSAGWTNGVSDEIFFFGGDTVCEAISVPEEIRGKLPGDYGRDRGIAWYYIGGFGLCHTDALNARVIKWASAA